MASSPVHLGHGQTAFGAAGVSNGRRPLHAGGRRGKERAANFKKLAEQRLAAGGRSLPQYASVERNCQRASWSTRERLASTSYAAPVKRTGPRGSVRFGQRPGAGGGSAVRERKPDGGPGRRAGLDPC